MAKGKSSYLIFMTGLLCCCLMMNLYGSEVRFGEENQAQGMEAAHANQTEPLTNEQLEARIKALEERLEAMKEEITREVLETIRDEIRRGELLPDNMDELIQRAIELRDKQRAMENATELYDNQKADLTEFFDGGYVSWVQIGNDSAKGQQVGPKETNSLLITAHIYSAKADKGHLSVYAYNLLNDTPYLIFQLPGFRFLDDYAQISIPWSGQYMNENNASSLLPSGNYKVFLKIDLFQAEEKVGFIKRVWGRQRPDFTVTVNGLQN